MAYPQLELQQDPGSSETQATLSQGRLASDSCCSMTPLPSNLLHMGVGWDENFDTTVLFGTLGTMSLCGQAPCPIWEPSL